LSSMLIAVPTNALFLPGLQTIRDVVQARDAPHAVVARDDLVSIERFFKRASSKKCNSAPQKLSINSSSKKDPSSTTSSSKSTPTTSSKSTPTTSGETKAASSGGSPNGGSGGSGNSVQTSDQPSGGGKAGLAWAMGNTPFIRNFMLPKVS
jgi:hypothetical protein